MLTDILRSAIADYVPTVNQLETTRLGIGYNRADAILYGLKVVGAAKEVVPLNGPGSGSSYTHPGYTPIDAELTGATVIASIVTDAIGSVTEVTTRTLTLADLGYEEQDPLWQRAATTLSPTNSGDIVKTTGNIIAGDNDETAILSTNSVSILGKGYYPHLDFVRKGAAGGAVQATDQLGHISVYGYYNNSNTATAFRIAVSAYETWGSSAMGTEADFITVAAGQTTQLSRIRLTGSGNVVINENGEATDFRVEGDTEQNLFLVDGSTNRVGIGTDGNVDTRLHVQCGSSWGQSLVKLEQADEDEPFIDYVGTSAANATKNISTYNSTGSVVGPKGANSTEDYWKYEGMIRVAVNAEENRWMPVYSHQSGT